jgi:steroid delta-isomerase-like uncharacterized protein
MSTEDNKALVHRLFDEVINGKNLDVVDEILAPDFDGMKSPGQEGDGSGRETWKQLNAMLFQAFPDFHVTIHDSIAAEDKVAVPLTIRGTHTGPYFGLPPSGEQVMVTAIDVYRIAGGKIAEGWSIVDALAFFNQLGLVPSFGELARVAEWEAR